ncbi:HNH endonuclease signature motif containing protein [Rosistilla oblonga]|uniref:HNH endonuclease signature motif containing protein n=1 Tax=Rosistilla oblonga TaxID=2527990 RepID=UPI003A97A299
MPKRARRLGERRPGKSPTGRVRVAVRKSAAKRGYDRNWRRERRAFLAENPYCAEHLRRGKIRLAQCVDHIIPHRGNKRLFWNRRNWQSLCNSCHSKKTLNERWESPDDVTSYEGAAVAPERSNQPKAEARQRKPRVGK